MTSPDPTLANSSYHEIILPYIYCMLRLA